MAQKGPMKARNRTRTLRPLGEETLRELALRYVGRYATTRAKLAAYLKRKLRERGWADDGQPDIEALVEALAAQGYVDDSSYALSKSRSLLSRGYGPRRLREQMRAAGIGAEDGAAAAEVAEAGAAEAALRLARKRRIGPFSDGPGDPAARERALAMMIRAGHSFALAKAILDLPYGRPVDEEELTALLRR